MESKWLTTWYILHWYYRLQQSWIKSSIPREVTLRRAGCFRVMIFPAKRQLHGRSGRINQHCAWSMAEPWPFGRESHKSSTPERAIEIRLWRDLFRRKSAVCERFHNGAARINQGSRQSSAICVGRETKMNPIWQPNRVSDAWFMRDTWWRRRLKLPLKMLFRPVATLNFSWIRPRLSCSLNVVYRCGGGFKITVTVGDWNWQFGNSLIWWSDLFRTVRM